MERETAGALTASISESLSPWQTWVPTLTWTGATPDGVVATTTYKAIGKTVFPLITITFTDSNATSGLYISLPINPKIRTMYPMLSCGRMPSITSVASTPTNAYVRDDGNNDIRVLFAAMTDGNPYVIRISGCYEAD